MNAMPEAYEGPGSVSYALNETANIDRLARMSPADRVHTGIKWLDEHAPPRWRDKIDTGILEVGSIRVCPAGQVFEADPDDPMSYPWGVAELKLRETIPGFTAPETAQIYGFCPLADPLGLTLAPDATELNDEWKKALA